MKFARLLARLFIGGMFIGHGTQKLFGWFGGPGIDGTTGMMDKLGLAPPRDERLRRLALGDPRRCRDRPRRLHPGRRRLADRRR